MADSEEEPKSLLIKVKESEKAGLKFNIQKTKIIAYSPITSQQIDGETIENSDELYFLRLQNHCKMVTAATKSKDDCSSEEKLWLT